MSILSKILKAPLVLLVFATFFTGIYAAYNKLSGITWNVPIVLGVIILLWIIGVFLERVKEEGEI